MKKDRFERAISRITFRLHCNAPWLITEQQALKLLRQEHNWIVRMVNDLPVFIDSAGNNPGSYLNRNELLARLKRRKG